MASFSRLNKKETCAFTASDFFFGVSDNIDIHNLCIYIGYITAEVTETENDMPLQYTFTLPEIAESIDIKCSKL